jgi:hypothetical protein
MAVAGDPDSQFAAAWPQDRSLSAPVASVSIKALTTQIRDYGVVHGSRSWPGHDRHDLSNGSAQ